MSTDAEILREEKLQNQIALRGLAAEAKNEEDAILADGAIHEHPFPRQITIDFQDLPAFKKMQKHLAVLQQRPVDTTKAYNKLVLDEQKEIEEGGFFPHVNSRRSEEIRRLKEQLDYEQTQIRRFQDEIDHRELEWIHNRHSEDPLLIEVLKKKIDAQKLRKEKIDKTILDKTATFDDYEKAASLIRNIEFDEELLARMSEDFVAITGLKEVPTPRSEPKK